MYLKKMVVIDLNLNCPKCHTSSSTRKEAVHEFRENHFLPTDGLFANLRISAMRRALPRQLQNQILLLLGSVPLHGLCPPHLSRKSTRYPSLSPRRQAETLSYGHPRKGLPQYAGSRQPNSRLADLR